MLLLGTPFSNVLEVNCRYVQLIINGTFGDPSTGATVAEFAVL